MKTIYTNNQGKLEIIQPFNFLRGKENQDKLMGQAKNENGQVFDIYPAECGLNNDCFCWAMAISKIKIKL